MTDTGNTRTGIADELNLESTRLASVRTDFALMRTGFTIASFGAGVTELIGRNTWPDWTTDLLTSAFVLVGMAFVQSGLISSRSSSKALGIEVHADPFTKRAVKIAPWLLQITLLVLLLMILFH
jgi:uncharacterized membrane protein YidH (DUF202 family)